MLSGIPSNGFDSLGANLSKSLRDFNFGADKKTNNCAADVLSGINNYNEENKTVNPLDKSNSLNQKKSFKNDSPLVKKGEAGYIPDMDKDGDGVITNDEFEEYCDEKQIGLKERLQLMETIQTAKILNQTEDDESKNKNENKNQIIYAREGEKSYDKNMDSNSDGKVTYEEYLRYCEKQRQENNLQDSFNESAKSKNPYSKTQEFSSEEITEPEIKVEIDA